MTKTCFVQIILQNLQLSEMRNSSFYLITHYVQLVFVATIDCLIRKLLKR